MTTIASEIASLTIVYSIVYSGADQRKHQSSASLAFVRGIHRWPVNSPYKRAVTRKMFSFDDVIMVITYPCKTLRSTKSLELWRTTLHGSTIKIPTFHKGDIHYGNGFCRTRKVVPVMSPLLVHTFLSSQIAKFMGPTWGPPGTCRPQVGPILAPWTLLSGVLPQQISKLWTIILFFQCSVAVKFVSWPLPINSFMGHFHWINWRV